MSTPFPSAFRWSWKRRASSPAILFTPATPSWWKRPFTPGSSRRSAGNLRLLVSDSGTLDRTLDQPRLSTHSADIQTVLAQARGLHAADRIYVSLLVPDAQAGMT